MAVIITQQPIVNEFSPAILASDTPILYVFESDQTAQPNFAFIVETLWNGEVVSTDKIFPERGNRAHYDAMSVTLAYARAEKRRAGAVVQGVLLPTVQVRVYERYGLPPETQAVYEESNISRIIKACCPDEEYTQRWLVEKYDVLDPWLSDAPDNKTVVAHDMPSFISAINRPFTNPVLDFVLYSKAEPDIAFTEVSFGTFPVIYPDIVAVHYDPNYFEFIANLLGAELSEMDRLEIKIGFRRFTLQFAAYGCGELNQVSWLNNAGGYDQYAFTHNREDRANVTTSQYGRQFGDWDESTNDYVYVASESGDTNYLKSITQTGSIFTDWITEKQQKWLIDILKSVDTLLYSYNAPGGGFRFPPPPLYKVERINVTESEAVTEKERFNDDISFKISFAKTQSTSINT